MINGAYSVITNIMFNLDVPIAILCIFVQKNAKNKLGHFIKNIVIEIYLRYVPLVV